MRHSIVVNANRAHTFGSPRLLVAKVVYYYPIFSLHLAQHHLLPTLSRPHAAPVFQSPNAHKHTERPRGEVGGVGASSRAGWVGGSCPSSSSLRRGDVVYTGWATIARVLSSHMRVSYPRRHVFTPNKSLFSSWGDVRWIAWKKPMTITRKTLKIVFWNCGHFPAKYSCEWNCVTLNFLHEIKFTTCQGISNLLSNSSWRTSGSRVGWL